jgi:hypothetical protein
MFSFFIVHIQEVYEYTHIGLKNISLRRRYYTKTLIIDLFRSRTVYFFFMQLLIHTETASFA